ncbi:MAG TPA: DUF3160 domain-containing protein [Pyrinomonadaceae bacterium]|nr:DUF3160 domain-containing protein [Pyrinomonadaceae bacterium]
MKQATYRKFLISILTTLFFINVISVVNGQNARVKPYKVSATLTEVINLKHFNKAMPVNAAKRAMLAKNLFAVSPTKSKQLFHIYEDNDYKNIPSFVTTDSLLHLYHIFFDFTLRTVEEKSLMPVLQRLTEGMLTDSIKTWNETNDAKLKSAALKNIAYFAIAAKNLGLNPKVPTEAESLIKVEMNLINRHEGFAVGTIFPYQIDYSQFIPRGHYTRSETLQKFFRVMMWYGLAPFALKSNQGRADETIRQSLLLTRSLYRANLENDWETIYESTSFYVGAADDITPAEWKALLDSVFGKNAELTAFTNTQKFDAFFEAAQKLRPAEIQNQRLIEPGKTVAPDAAVQFRLMGQRYIPDSEILQKLSVPLKRVFPTGLDVMSVLGSNRATNILDTNPTIYNPNNWSEYKSERTKLVGKFSKIKHERWTSNLYWSWLDALRILLEPAPEGYPSFMRNTAWEDKSLNTTLGSWAELRHDTILYGKQSGAEMGDGDEPAPYKGYVEPNVRFWDRMLNLTKQSREGLTSRKLMLEDLEGRFESFEEILTNLKQISEKELRNEKLTADEYQSIRTIGGTLEYLTLSVMTGNPDTWELVNETDKDMAVIADVHTGGDKVLEESVGHANEILVIVPIEGKLVLTRGAVFSYYEFIYPSADRLTDEKWQKMVNAGRAPAPPIWTKSFLLSNKK